MLYFHKYSAFLITEVLFLSNVQFMLNLSQLKFSSSANIHIHIHKSGDSILMWLVTLHFKEQNQHKRTAYLTMLKNKMTCQVCSGGSIVLEVISSNQIFLLCPYRRFLTVSFLFIVHRCLKWAITMVNRFISLLLNLRN